MISSTHFHILPSIDVAAKQQPPTSQRNMVSMNATSMLPVINEHTSTAPDLHRPYVSPGQPKVYPSFIVLERLSVLNVLPRGPLRIISYGSSVTTGGNLN